MRKKIRVGFGEGVFAVKEVETTENVNWVETDTVDVGVAN